jgi:integrase
LQAQGSAQAAGTWQDPRHTSRPFSWAVEQWQTARAVHHAPRTRARNDGLLRNYLLPAWGDTPLSAMDRPAVKQWFAQQDWTPATARKVQVVLSSVLSEGVELGVLRDNPAARLKLASQPRIPMTVLTAQEVRAVAEAVEARSGRPADGLAVLTAAYTGLRAGELWALQAQDLIAGDDTQPRLLVRRTLTTANGQLVFRDSTKTGRQRVVSLPTFLARQLAAHAKDHAPTDLIFQAPEGGPVRHELFTARVFRPVVKGHSLVATVRQGVEREVADKRAEQEATAAALEQRETNVPAREWEASPPYRARFAAAGAGVVLAADVLLRVVA